MRNKRLSICDTSIHPGECANLALPLPERYTCAPLYMPIKVVHGKKTGPCIVIFAILRGNELNGLEIVNRILNEVNSESLSGTLIAIPVVNVLGLTQAAFSVSDSLSSAFPGNEQGTFGERIAYLFTNEILKKADYCIEIQTGELNHNILPQIYCSFNDPTAKKLASFFQTPVVMNLELIRNPLRTTIEDLQIPFLVYQAGEAMRFDENAIQQGVSGILNVMSALELRKTETDCAIRPIFSQEAYWVAAHKGGILQTSITLGQTVSKNTLLGRIVDPFGANLLEPVYAPDEAVVVGINMTPLVYEGLALFKLASFLDCQKAENVIKKWESTEY